MGISPLLSIVKDVPPVASSEGTGPSMTAPSVGAVDLGASEVKNSPLSGWSSLFTSVDVRLQFVAPMIKDGQKVVAISKSVFEQGSSLWNDCSLGQFFDPPQKIAVIHSFAVKL